MAAVCPGAYLNYWDKEKSSMLHRGAKSFLKYIIIAIDCVYI